MCKEGVGLKPGQEAWLLPLPALCPFSSLTSDPLLTSASTPVPNFHCIPCSQLSASKFTSLFCYPKGRERPGQQEERGKPTAEPILGSEGKPRKEGRRGGVGVFWKKRRLFLSQDRREHCLKQWPSWGCATLRSPTSNSLCVCLSHGADLGFKSLPFGQPYSISLPPSQFIPLLSLPPLPWD